MQITRLMLINAHPFCTMSMTIFHYHTAFCFDKKLENSKIHSEGLVACSRFHSTRLISLSNTPRNSASQLRSPIFFVYVVLWLLKKNIDIIVFKRNLSMKPIPLVSGFMDIELLIYLFWTTFFQIVIYTLYHSIRSVCLQGRQVSGTTIAVLQACCLTSGTQKGKDCGLQALP